MLSYLGQLDIGDVRQAAGQVFQECGIEGCKFHSLGFVCVGCSQPLCNRHVYFQLPPLRGAQKTFPKPVPKCPLCVVASHPELFDDDG